MKNKKVVSFERGADFYFGLSFKHIQNGRLKTALRYIEKAVKIKPDDSYMQYNYAGILAELGHIEQSTSVLLNIVNNLDPSYDECYFGLGCNYLQMQKIKKALECFEKYLKLAPYGDYAEEAEHLMEMLYLIIEANNNLDDDELERIYKIEEEAIKYMERREYEKAMKNLEEVVSKLPNAIPAKNNLSLTHYYLGNISTAITIAKEVLDYEKENIHANCNLAIFYSKIGISNMAERHIRIIKKLYPENEDYAYKIADTLGCLNRHKEAYDAYKRLIRMDDKNPQYIHLMAIAAFNCKKYNEALNLWEKLKKYDEEGYLGEYYYNIADETKEGIREFRYLPYICQLPKEEVGRRIDIVYEFLTLDRDEIRELLNNDKSIKNVIYFVISFDKYVLRRMLFEKIKQEKIIELEDVIRKYILRPDVDKNIKIESVFLLNKIGAKEPYHVLIDGDVKAITIESDTLLRDEWKKEWEDVKDTTLKMMKNCYKTPYKKIVEDIWYDFIRSSYPYVPKIGKIEIWAAALEFAYCKFTCKEVTQQQLADKYNVSKSSISEKSRIIFSYIGNKFGERE
ncbi:tetratricopeptide repeat protein [Lutispora thermophila]|uniref:Tetratricopeptide repeat-containing protein n=1 Tax=Lutispora thermophila DSM 19022 TaxID=1122184 RepID=A0A1M6B905_9FIRM|nr:tetratricopeptide repeat protein [Lutispora thermophila]SHI45176.1 Tetratricopeptide repeat-containing protein [Lutispora thermophila DSM 19022]